MGSPFMARAIAGHLPLKNSHLLSAVIVGLMVTGVQAADPEFKKECTMGLAMKEHIPMECSVMWKSENGKTYCFANEEAKSHFLKDKKGNLNQAEVF
jgi:YHS domain-containing protein